MPINIYLIYLGVLFLSLNMDKHYKEVFNKNINKKFKTFAKIIGTLLFIISLFLFIRNMGISLGITIWITIFTPIIIFIALILTYKPHLLLKISVLLLFLSIILYLM